MAGTIMAVNRQSPVWSREAFSGLARERGMLITCYDVQQKKKFMSKNNVNVIKFRDLQPYENKITTK